MQNRKGKCLIVEDSRFDQKMMARVVTLTNRNMDMQFVTNLTDARKVLHETPMAIILLDNNLPDGHGIAFAEELSQDPQLSQIPVIMVSDWPSPFMWEKAESAGVHFVVNKSEFRPGMVTAALDKRRVH